MKMYSIILLIFLSFNVRSEEAPIKKSDNKWALRGGLTLAYTTLNAEAATADHTPSYGINTQFSYLFKKVEINLNAYILLGHASGLQYHIDNINLFAEGDFRSFFFAPMIKYITDLELKKNWRLYLTLGAGWGIRSMKVLNFIDQGKEKNNHRINVSSRGLIGGLGFQEISPIHSMGPLFVEILGAYFEAYQLTLVENLNFNQVSKRAREDKHFHAFDGLLMINFGLTFL